MKKKNRVTSLWNLLQKYTDTSDSLEVKANNLNYIMSFINCLCVNSIQIKKK